MVSSVLTVAPLRVSFVGGGTDLESFYRSNDGFVVSSAIKKYVYVHAKIHDDSFEEKYRISYSKVEHANSINEIENVIVRNCLKALNFDQAIQISTLSDLPAGTGLGSSSSFTVATLLAIHTLKGENPSKTQLAEEACEVEINMMKQPIGRQDQYATAFGGLNYLEFTKDYPVSVVPINISKSKLDQFFSRIHLFWTGLRRDASTVLVDQVRRAPVNNEKLNVLAKAAQEFRSILEKEPVDWSRLEQLISDSWSIKQTLTPLVSNDELDSIIDMVRSDYGGGVKLLGAGGGGFVLSFSSQSNLAKEAFNRKENRLGLKSFSPRMDSDGARVISVF